MPKPTAELPPDPLEPPASEVIQRGQWQAVPDDDPLVRYLTTRVWDRDMPARRWEVARLSAAAHIFREVDSGWAVVAKFYTAKTGKDAHRHAERARHGIKRVLQAS